jgi:hypothetical protein
MPMFTPFFFTKIGFLFMDLSSFSMGRRKERMSALADP